MDNRNYEIMEEDQGDYRNKDRNNSLDGENNNTKENFEDNISADLGKENNLDVILFYIYIFTKKRKSCEA